MSYIGNQITGFLGTGSLTVTTSTVAVEGDALFSADGNVVLGDASSDTITINAATASIPNNLNIDSNTLFIDAANNRIGIGTNSPDRTIKIHQDNSYVWIADAAGGNVAFIGGGGSNDGRMRLYDSSHNTKVDIQSEAASYFNGGNVGIGTSSPDTPLEISTTGSGVTDVLKLTTTGTGTVPSIVFEGDQGGTQHTAARIRAGQEDASNGNIIFEVEDAGSLDEAIRIMSDGSVGIGTSSPDNPLHISASVEPYIRIENTDTILSQGQVTGGIIFEQNDSTAGATGITGRIQMRSAARPDTGTYFGTAADMDFLVSGNSAGNASDNASKTAMTIRAGTGNIGIGTSSPAAKLVVSDASALEQRIIHEGNGTTVLRRDGDTSFLLSESGAIANRDLAFGYQTSAGSAISETMRIEGNTGNVGIGTSSPDKALTISASDSQIRLYDADGTNQFASFQSDNGTTKITSRNNTSNGTIAFQRFDGTTVSESMRIDSTGNLLVGQSSTTVPGLSNTTTGLSLTNNGYIFASKADDNVAWFNRNTSDGSIISLRKDGSPVGSIAAAFSDLAIGNGDTGLHFNSGSEQINPWNLSTNLARDNGINLGASGARFKDLFLSGSVYLGGTGSANALDDYEEGTWTPTNAGDATGTIAGSSAGQYTKIGRFVHVQGQIQITANFTGNSIGGLPFTPRIQSGLSNVYGAFIGATNAGAIYMAVTDAGTNINLYTNAVNTGLSPSTAYGTIRFAITYETNA